VIESAAVALTHYRNPTGVEYLKAAMRDEDVLLARSKAKVVVA
jgi:hypothetical protein